MSTIGPALPPHLVAKRKREEEEEDDDGHPLTRSPSASSNEEGDKRRRVIGPALPPTSTDSSSNEENEKNIQRTIGHSLPTGSVKEPSKSSSNDERKPQRVLGPSLPPAPLSEKSTDPNSDSDSDDGLGPMPAVLSQTSPKGYPSTKSQFDEPSASGTWEDSTASKKAQRDEWMLLPPTSDDWSSRVDPTKLKNRKFNTGKGAKALADKSSGGNQGSWIETPEEKRQRLEDEVLGRKSTVSQAGMSSSKEARRSEAEARETERRIREYNEKNRGSSLMDEHKKTVPKEKEDDPSKRAFDKEKDIGLGMKIGHAKRKELLNNAKDFGSRFAGGKYL